MKFKKLVVLDKIQMTQEQEKQIKALAEKVEVYNDTPNENEAIKRIANADAVLTSWTEITKKILESSKLKYLGVWATGYSWIDVKTANEKGITVTNVPGYATESVAELVISQLISILRNTKQADERCRRGKFEQEGLLGEELKGKTIGIIGFGRIGSRVAELAKAFGMKVIYYSRTKKENDSEFCTLQELLKKSDIVTIHASSGGEILGERELKLLKNGSIVINFGVAGAVNENALIKELEKGRLKAVLDHFENHKLKEGLVNSQNALLTPEIGFYTKQALEKLTDICINNAKSFLEGKVQNKV